MIKIVRATTTQVRPMATLMASSALLHRYRVSARGARESLTQALRERELVLVAMQGNAVLGFAWVIVTRALDRAAYLRLLLVSEEHQSRGIGAALLAFASLMLLAWAYARAEAQHLAPTEYSGFVWAAFYGWIVFAEPVQPFTLGGAALIVFACLIAARTRLPADHAEGAL